MSFIRKIVKEKGNQSAESQCASVDDIPDIKSLHYFSKKFLVFSKVQVWKNTFQE